MVHSHGPSVHSRPYPLQLLDVELQLLGLIATRSVRILIRQCDLSICRRGGPSHCARLLPSACMLDMHQGWPYVARSRFVTYLLRSTLGAAGFTITGATPWSASGAQCSLFWSQRPWDSDACCTELAIPSIMLLSCKNHIRQNLFYSMFSRTTSDKHVPSKIWAVAERCTFWSQKNAATHVPTQSGASPGFASSASPGFSGLTGAGPRRLRQQHGISRVSVRFHVDVVHVVLLVRKLPSSSQHSSPCRTSNLCHHT